MNGALRNVFIGLVYPAILGAIAYNLLDKIVYQNAQLASIAICITVVIHYVVDYAYTATFTTKSNYNWLTAMCDILIITSLFVAGNSVWDAGLIKNYWLFPAMVLTKIGTLGWDKTTSKKFERLPYDLFFLVVYIICALIFCPRIAIPGGTESLLKSSPPLYLVPVVFIFLDALFYGLHIYKKCKLFGGGN